MSQRYAALIAEWRAASGETRALQKRIKEQFDMHLAGNVAPPSDADLDRLKGLRQQEQEKLDAAMKYIKVSATGPATGFLRRSELQGSDAGVSCSGRSEPSQADRRDRVCYGVPRTPVNPRV
jgi:hypothetical protein